MQRAVQDDWKDRIGRREKVRSLFLIMWLLKVVSVVVQDMESVRKEELE